MPAPARRFPAMCGPETRDASAAGPETARVQDVGSCLVNHVIDSLRQATHERVIVSWRFKSTRAIFVQAASSAGSASGGGGDWPILSSACASPVLQRYSPRSEERRVGQECRS